jgi:hypothetical protein
METIAFVNDKFYRAFKGVKFNDQSTSMTVDAARRYWSKLQRS